MKSTVILTYFTYAVYLLFGFTTLCTFYTVGMYAVHLLYGLFLQFVRCTTEHTVLNDRTDICLFHEKVVCLFNIVRSFVNITWPQFFSSCDRDFN